MSLGVSAEFDHPKLLKAVERTVAAPRRASGAWPPCTYRGGLHHTLQAGFDFCCCSATCGYFGRAGRGDHRLEEGMYAMNASFHIPFGAISEGGRFSRLPRFRSKASSGLPAWKWPIWTTPTLWPQRSRRFRHTYPARSPVSPESAPPNDRLSIIARFGVGYDTLDVPACTGPRTLHWPPRPTACAAPSPVYHDLHSGAHGKLMVKDRLTRQGPSGFPVRRGHISIGLVGKMLSSSVSAISELSYFASPARST